MRNLSLLPYTLQLLAVCLCISTTIAADRPNVIVIMTDDQGYGDLSITGNEIVDTPHMDRIAEEGAWMKRFYVSPVCTPTRACFMTGRYNYRTRAIDTYLGRANMDPDEVTLAEVLSDAGYATGIFGKWHLGDYYPTRAIDQGFQEAVVHQGGGLRQPSNPIDGDRYHDPILYHNGVQKRYEGFCTDIYFDEAAAYIEKQAEADQPFFVFIPTNAPHGPFDEPPTRESYEFYKAKLPKGKKDHTAVFYSMVKNIDDNMGRLAATLERLQIDDDTLVIFMTDNGPAGGGSAGPFRGAKASVYEGGIRTVCFLRWPAVIEAGSTDDTMLAHIDLMPTLLDVCGVDLPEGVDFDGRSFRPLLVEKGVKKEEPEWADRYVFQQWHRGNAPSRYHHFAVIDPEGRWKLLNRSPIGLHELPADKLKLELYDLHNDVGETTDLAAKNPEMVEKLKTEYEKWLDEVSATRDDNYAMPPIVIGADQQQIVELTTQDKRSDPGAEQKGWWTKGSWPVDVTREGPYTIEVILTQPAVSDVEVAMSLQSEGGETVWSDTLSMPRGVRTAPVGGVSLPVGAQATFRAEVQGIDQAGLHVYQVLVK